MSDLLIRSGYHVVSNNTIEFIIPLEYNFVEYLGGGNYGNVILVREDCPELQQGYVDLAVKKMYDPFSSIIKARRLYREFKLLKLMNHENVIRFVDIYTPDVSLATLRNVYIVTRYAGLSLKTVLDKQKLSQCKLLQASHIKYIIYQILRALKYLHSANVIHRDLKPSNLAISGECDVTVLDFGLARTVSQAGDNLTAYVISRWYRSPEVIYWNNVSYNAKADLWSVGCIMAELLTGEVLFRGAEAMEQYKLIVELCGAPDNELLGKIEAHNSAAMRSVVERMGDGRARQDFRKYFRGQPDGAIDLLDKFLVLDPDRRISVEEALTHPYVQEHHLPSDEPIAKEPFNIDDQNDATRTIEEWKEIIWNEIQDLNSQNENGENMETE
jgi:p38 MAP kinase